MTKIVRGRACPLYFLAYLAQEVLYTLYRGCMRIFVFISLLISSLATASSLSQLDALDQNLNVYYQHTIQQDEAYRRWMKLEQERYLITQPSATEALSQTYSMLGTNYTLPFSTPVGLLAPTTYSNFVTPAEFYTQPQNPYASQGILLQQQMMQLQQSLQRASY